METRNFKKWKSTDKKNSSPCPMLNTLANYGIIPKKHISTDEIKSGLEIIGCDYVIRTLLGYIIDADFNGNLHNLCTLGDHTKLEHDVSLTREDKYLGNHILFNPKRYKYIKKFSTDGKYLTMKQLAKYRNKMKERSIRKNPELTYGLRQILVASAESAILSMVMSDHTGNIRLDWLDVFLKKEKLPFELGWKIKSLSFLDIIPRTMYFFTKEYL